MTLSIEYRAAGASRSFPEGWQGGEECDGASLILILAGQSPVIPEDISAYAAVLVELGNDCLATLAGDTADTVFGFARFRFGDAEPTNLIELVKGERFDLVALEAAKSALEGVGLQVSVCADRVGRIVDRLIRPQLNLAYAAVDSGLAMRDAIESCVRGGLGYRQGLMAAVEQGGLDDHYDVCTALFEAYGLAQFAPARQAIVARRRKDAGR